MLDSNIVINAAIDSIIKHPAHHLEIGIRRSVWLLFGDYSGDEECKNFARKKRFLLSVLCAEYVRNIHFKYFYADSDILKLYSSAINIATLYWEEKINSEEINLFSLRFYRILENLGNTGKLELESFECNLAHERAIFAMTSVWECLRVTLYDEPFNETIESNVKDTDMDLIDIYAADAAYWAASAYAGSVWDLENLDKNKRLKFWKWWLEEAVPKVLNS
jgi:hypothetical protein